MHRQKTYLLSKLSYFTKLRKSAVRSKFQREKNSWKRLKKWFEVKIKNQYYNLKIMCSRSNVHVHQKAEVKPIWQRQTEFKTTIREWLKRFDVSKNLVKSFRIQITLLKKLKLVSRMKAHPGLYQTVLTIKLTSQIYH